MSASTAALSGIPFRKVDIDQYDEDRVLPSELYQPDPRPPQQVLSDTQAKDRAVRGLLQRGDVAAALKECVREGEWPYGEDSVPEIVQAKQLALNLILSVLNSSRSTDIPALVATLEPAEQVTLMKYLYKAMENLGDSSGNVVLGWHEKLVEVAGIGCIVRVMTDRRRV
ncbi:SPOSA6832_03553 [Sporobolomyces salmonicolor]|uniref:Actin-related protein 2/3 complex subunit 5 n=1 Tax=Sporidiobolus salmonicolor TaxID=5005 RepID=A0A0D6EPT3_SPOSA|nr:SPOSA6832_03553 [Sporobolomyces salmonicolor]